MISGLKDQTEGTFEQKENHKETEAEIGARF